MKMGLITAALAAVLITGSTASSQAIPAAPISKSIQQNSSSLVEPVYVRRGYRGYRRYGYSGYRGYRRAGVYGYRGYRRYGYYRGYRRAGIYGYRGYRGYRWGGVGLYRNRGCW